MSNTIALSSCWPTRTTSSRQRSGAMISAAEQYRDMTNEPRRVTLIGGDYSTQPLKVEFDEVARRFTGKTGAVRLIVDHSTSGCTINDVEDVFFSDERASVLYGSFGFVRWAHIAKDALGRAHAKAPSISLATGRLRVARLTAVQATFGLSTQAFAEVLGVSRPALYKWLDASKDITLQDASRERLAIVESLANAWRERTNAPLGSAVHEPLGNGGTLQELLTAETINVQAVIAAFDELLTKVHAGPKPLSKKMAEAGFNRRASRRSISDDE